jgi:hypothetical protein
MDTALANIQVWNFVYHTDQQAENVAETFKWINKERPTDHRLTLLKSIKNNVVGSFPYTEYLSLIGEDAKVMRTMVSPEQVVAYMSEMNDKEKLFPLVTKHQGDYSLAIEEYIQTYMKRKSA